MLISLNKWKWFRICFKKAYGEKLIYWKDICCRHTLEWHMAMRPFQCVPTTYIFSINEFFTISFFKTNSKPLSFIQRNEHVQMYKWTSSCSLDDNNRLSILCFWQLLLKYNICYYKIREKTIWKFTFSKYHVHCLLANCQSVLKFPSLYWNCLYLHDSYISKFEFIKYLFANLLVGWWSTLHRGIKWFYDSM